MVYAMTAAARYYHRRGNSCILGCLWRSCGSLSMEMSMDRDVVGRRVSLSKWINFFLYICALYRRGRNPMSNAPSDALRRRCVYYHVLPYLEQFQIICIGMNSELLWSVDRWSIRAESKVSFCQWDNKCTIKETFVEHSVLEMRIEGDTS